METPLFTATLPVNLTNNNNGQSRHFGKSASDRKELEKILRGLGLVRKPFDVPVVVYVTRVLGKGQRCWDSSSGLRGTYKQLEDSAVACGWFQDDSYKYIKETRFFQDDTQRSNGPAVVIEVVRFPA